MAKTFRIDIVEPIWSSKSVGVNLTNCNPDDIVEVNILYENKRKKRVYPFTYLIKASEADKYPAQMRGGQYLHIIPIKDFQIK